MTLVNGHDRGENSRPTIRLEQAFGWTCPDCSTRNYVEAERVTFENDAERREAYLEMGMIEEWEDTPPAEDGQFLMAPSTVRCSKCRRKYPSVEEDEVEMEEPDDD